MNVIDETRERWKRLGLTDVAKVQSNMFKTWVYLCGVGFVEVKDNCGYMWCPIHEKFERLQFECGLGIEKAVEILAEEIPKHSKLLKVKE